MNVTKRFSNRVEDYIKYRPGYPEAILDTLAERIGFVPAWSVADIGSGTGIVTEMLLQRGNTVYGVEPNADMRGAAEKLLAAYPRFHSVDGSAEATTLDAASIDLVVAAQAFHWFDRTRARDEFRRILKPKGWVALLWNDRRPDSTPFLRAYEETLLRCGTDYASVNHRNIADEEIAAWFGGPFNTFLFPNFQHFDWDGLYGRAMSSSYVPAPGDPRHAAFTEALRQTFDAHNRNGQVVFEYDTRLYVGSIAGVH